MCRDFCSRRSVRSPLGEALSENAEMIRAKLFGSDHPPAASSARAASPNIGRPSSPTQGMTRQSSPPGGMSRQSSGGNLVRSNLLGAQATQVPSPGIRGESECLDALIRPHTPFPEESKGTGQISADEEIKELKVRSEITTKSFPRISRVLTLESASH